MSEYLTKDQIKECKYYFDLLDKDGVGHITTKELGTIMKSIGLIIAEAELKNIINEINLKGTDEIDFPDFVSLLTRKMNDIDTEEELKRVFKEFDKNNRGLIKIEDLQSVTSMLGEKFTGEELNEMLAEADVDHDGALNYEDFARMMMAK